jgi:multidrug efflux pump subunit AcrB
MKPIVTYFIKHPIWANVFMVAILLFGVFQATQLRTSFFPEAEPMMVNVDLVYPGASAEEIENSIVQIIEEKLTGITNIEYHRSVIRENAASIRIKVRDKADPDEVLEDVKNAVDQVTPWPDGAEIPRVTKSRFGIPAVVVAVSGDMDLWEVKRRGQILEELMLAKEGVSSVNIMGYPGREIAIEISEKNLRRYNLSFDQVAMAVRAFNTDISGGKIDTYAEELMIRAYQKKASVHHITNLVVKTDVNGSVVRVGDLAQVIEKWEDSPSSSTYNGKEAVFVFVSQSEGENLLTVSKEAREALEDFIKLYPEITTDVVFDSTVNLRDRIRMLRENGLVGLLLVLLTLTFFLNFRVAFWVAIGIPISFAGMFIIASASGITINMLSLFGMIIVIGILVDDAIVVAEQTFQGIEKGMGPSHAAQWAVLKVIAPVFTAVSTTIIAFVPFFLLEGQLGSMIWQVALVVIAALVFSLFESFFILPSHLAHTSAIKQENPSKVRKKIESFYKWLANDIYGTVLKWSMHNKLVIVAIILFSGLFTVGLFQGGIMKMNPFPNLDQESLELSISLTAGTQKNITDSILQLYEEQVLEYDEQIIKPQFGSRFVKATYRQLGSNNLDDVGGHAGKLTVYLVEAGQREMSSVEFQQGLRQYLRQIPEVKKTAFQEGRWGKPITVSISGKDYNQIRKAKDLLLAELEKYSTLKDVVDMDAEGMREVHLDLLPKAYSLGLTHMEIASQIRKSFYGAEIQRIQRGQDEIKIWARYAEKDRKSLGNLDEMVIRLANGSQVPLRELVQYKIERGVDAIKHRDGKRAISIEADLANNKLSSTEIAAEISKKTFPVILSQVQGVEMEFRGQAVSNKSFGDSLKRTMIPALLGIIFLMILVFRSWFQSLLIFSMIPLGMFGAVWGHLIHGMMMSRMSTFGLIALTGIVINDSIVFVDQINYYIRKGEKVFDAVYKAGIDRMRPILMTTITTVVGLAPLIMESSFQAQFLIPMAISVAWGMIFGCLFILLAVPAYFLILNTVRYYWAVVWRWVMKHLYDTELPIPTRENVEPAFHEAHLFDEEVDHV